ncbi:MAG: hypothetical protein HYW24_04585 [Candidatus Aenigmarchaeota archaeon]|nr:hypothetical protein [Candidatus Aenigmarchaeota archaeon]
MTIDKTMLGAIRHCLMTPLTAARAIHGEIQDTRRSFDYAYDGHTLGEDIDEVKQTCLQVCKEMLEDPVPTIYVGIENYHLTTDDRNFLTRLHYRMEESNWRNPQMVEEIGLMINNYAPHGGFESGK